MIAPGKNFIQTARYHYLGGVLLAIGIFLLPLFSYAATYTWDGGGSTNDWSECANWTSNTCPGSADIAQFDATSVKNATVDASFGGTVLGVAVNAGYTGVITQARNLTIGASNFTMASGTWAADTTTFDLNGSFTQTGGTFFAAAGTSTVQANMTLSGGTMTASSARVFQFDDSSTLQSSTLTCTGTLLPAISVLKNDNGGTFTLGSGCSATSTLFENIGVVFNQTTISGTLNLTQDINTILDLTVSSGGVINANGYKIRFYDTGSSQAATLTCTGALNVPVQIDKNDNGSDFTIAAGCAATTTGTVVLTGGTANATDLVVNGTLVIAQTSTTTVMGGVTVSASGTLTINADLIVNSAFTLTSGGTFNHNNYAVQFYSVGTSQPGTLTCTGAFPGLIQINKTHNGGDFTIVAGCAATTTRTVVLSGGTATDLFVNGTLVIASSATSTVTGVVSIANGGVLSLGANMDVQLDFTLNASGTLNANGHRINFFDTGFVASTLTCTGAFPASISVEKNDNTNNMFTLASGCAATSTVFYMDGSITVNGTLSFSPSATSTVTRNITVNGTLNAPMPLRINFNLTVATSGVLNTNGNTVQFVDDGGGGWTSTLTCVGNFSALISVVKDTSTNNNFTLSSGCVATSTTFYMAAQTSIFGTLNLTQNLSINFNLDMGSTGVINGNGYSVNFIDDGGGGWSSTFTCTGLFGAPISIYKDFATSNSFTISAGCSATTTTSLVYMRADLTINGTLSLQANVSANFNVTVGAAGSLVSNGYLLNIIDDGGGGWSSTLTCTGALGIPITIYKDAATSNFFTLAAGCSATTTSTAVYSQANFSVNGALVITSSATTTVLGSVSVGVAGTLTLNAGLVVYQDFTVASGGSVVPNGSTVQFYSPPGTAYDSTLTCTGNFSPTIWLEELDGNADFTISSGCRATSTLPVRVYRDLTVNGTLSLTNTAEVRGAMIVNGTTTHTGTSVSVWGDFTLAASASFVTATTVQFYSPPGIAYDSILTCTGIFPAPIWLEELDGNADFTISSGCRATSTLPVRVYKDVTVNGTLALSNTAEIRGNMTINGTSTYAGSILSVWGNFSLAPTASFSSATTVQMYSPSGFGYDTTLTCTGNFPAPIWILKIDGNADFTLAANCTATSTAVFVAREMTVAGSLSFSQAPSTVTTAIVPGRLALNGYNFSPTTFTLTGTLARIGNETITTPTLGDASTIEYTGTSTYSTLGGTTDFESIAFTGGGTYNINTAITVEDNFTSMASSSFVMGTSGTLTLDGGNQTITGTSTFNNLTKNVTATATLTFGAGQEQTFSGNSNVKGTGLAPLLLRSTATGTQYRLKFNGAYDMEYVSLRDANNTGSSTVICFPGCTDVANNTNFSFVGDELSGLRRWDGGGANTLWSNPLNWEFDQVPASSETVVFATTSVKNATIDAAFGTTIGGIIMVPGYTGTISASTSLTITADGLSIADGTFLAPSSTLTITGGFTQLPAGDFVSTGVTTLFAKNSTTTVVLNGAVFGDVVITGAVATTSLLAYWAFDESSASSSVLDSSTNDYQGTAAGSGGTNNLPQPSTDVATSIPFYNPYSKDFDASDDTVTATGINLANQSFTVMGWAKREGSGSWDIIHWQGSGSNNNGLFFGFRNTNDFGCGFWGNDLITPSTYSSTNWHHWACIYDANTNLRSIYRDGMVVATGTASADFQGSGTWYVGYSPAIGGSYFDGKLDDLRVHTTALSASQVAAVYSVGTTQVADAFVLASGTLAVGDDLTVNSVLDVSTSACSGASCGVQVGGDFTNRGTFIPRTGTVTLTGGTQTLTGTTTFYNLTESAATGTLFIQAGSLQTITNNLTLTGNTSTGLKLRSTATGTAFRLSVGGNESLSYLDVRDANNTGATLDCVTLCLDSANNTNWNFGSGLFPGKRRWDGGGSGTLWTTAANWQFDEVPSNTETVVFDTTGTKDSRITTAFGATMGGIVLDTGYSGTLTASTTNFTVTGDGLTIRGGTFVAPPSNLVLTNTLLSQPGGTFNANGGNVVLQGTTTIAATGVLNNVQFDATYSIIPLAHWRFDEAAASAVVLNAASTSATGTPNGTSGTNNLPQPSTDIATTVTFYNPYSKDFDGIDDTVTASGINVANQSFTVMAWAKRRNVGGWEIIFGQGISTGGDGLHIGFDANRFVCNFWGYGLATPSTYTDTEWNHWACTYNADTNTRTIYRNGVSVTSDTPIDYTGSGTFTIGSSPLIGSSNFDGKLDDVRVYGTALASTSIASIYASGESGFGGSLIVSTSTLTTTGDVTIGIGSVIDLGTSSCSGGSCALSVGGNYTNNGTFLARAGTTTFSGVGAQTATSTLSSSSSFHHLAITNTGGTVTFGAPVNTTGTFSMGPNTSAAFLVNATHTVTRLDLNGGTAGTRAAVRSSVPGTRWTLVPTTVATTSYVSVTDSLNASTSNIQCLDGCADGGNNIGWNFPLGAGALTLLAHPSGQPSNQFTFQNKDDAPLYRFAIATTTESGIIDDLTITLRGVKGIDSTKLTDLRLYRDVNNDGALDGGDVQVLGTGIIATQDQNGTISFSTGTTSVMATTSFIVTGDTVAIKNNEYATFVLQSGGIIAIGASTSLPMLTDGSAGSVQHTRTGNASDGSSGQIGGDAPVGIVRSGGASGGGQGDFEAGQQLDGDNIAPDPDYFRPTTSGTPDNEWTGGTNAYNSDGTYATSNTTNQRQTYGGFGFSIPTTNTIQGIQVKLDGSGTTAAGTIQVGLSWDGGSSVTTLEATPTLSGSDIVYNLGGQTNLWGRTWTAAELNDTFRLRVVAQPSSNTVRLDAIEVRVYHTAEGGGEGGGEI
jgi:hypothetical protein